MLNQLAQIGSYLLKGGLFKIFGWHFGRGLTLILLVGILLVSFGMNRTVKAAGLSYQEIGGEKQDLPTIPSPPSENQGGIENAKSFLPLINKSNRIYPTLPLGSAVLTKDAYLCDPTTNQFCYDLTVTCSQLTQPLGVTLHVGDPTPPAVLKGTIMFFSGYTGDYLWEVTAKAIDVEGDTTTFSLPVPADQILNPNAGNYPKIIADLRAEGFRTVQVVWASNWYFAEHGVEEGMGDLTCRPATVIRWVYDHLHSGQPDQPFCADGHSNGASQLAYSLARYGMGRYLDLAIFESGPNWTYLDQSCIQDDAAYQDIWTPDDGRKNFDLSYGYYDNGSGPCAQKLKRWRTTFQNDSLGYGNWQFFYPRTMMAFLFGELDALAATRNSGRRFSDLLVSNATPFWSRQDLPNTGHSIGGTPEGLTALGTTLSAQCIAR